MKQLIIILLVSNCAFSQIALIDTNSILIGEQINFSISNPISETEVWPTYDIFLVDGIEIIKQGELDTTNNLISQNFIITAWDSGSYYIPPILFSKASRTEGLLLNVQTIILEEDAKLKDIKEPMKAPIGWSDIWPWILIFLALALIIFLLKRYVFIKKNKLAESKTEIPADIIALNSLATLSSNVSSELEIKLYYVRLSEIIRRYLEKRYQFIALELPTDDIIRELNKLSVKSDVIQKVCNLLERSDLAKFAKNQPNNLENIESLNTAKEIIQDTKIITRKIDYKNAEEAGCLLQILCFIFPLLGLILYFAWQDSKLQASKDCGRAALWGWVIGMLIALMIFIYVQELISNIY